MLTLIFANALNVSIIFFHAKVTVDTHMIFFVYVTMQHTGFHAH